MLLDHEKHAVNRRITQIVNAWVQSSSPFTTQSVPFPNLHRYLAAGKSTEGYVMDLDRAMVIWERNPQVLHHFHRNICEDVNFARYEESAPFMDEAMNEYADDIDEATYRFGIAERHTHGLCLYCIKVSKWEKAGSCKPDYHDTECRAAKRRNLVHC